MIRSLETVQD